MDRAREDGWWPAARLAVVVAAGGWEGGDLALLHGGASLHCSRERE